MTVNKAEGFEFTKTIACDTVGGTLRAINEGRVYKETKNKDMPESSYNLGLFENEFKYYCYKECDETNDCVAFTYDSANKACQLKSATSCSKTDQILVDAEGIESFELAENLSKMCNVSPSTTTFPANYGFVKSIVTFKQKQQFLKTDGIEAKGECAKSWSLADAPVTEFSKNFDSSSASKIIAGDIFTSLFKTTTPTTACENKKCTLFATAPVPSLYGLPDDQVANVELDGTELKMVNNVGLGYDFDISVNCDSVDGSLVLSPGGRVYRKTEGKSFSDFILISKNLDSVDECIKLCDDTTDCLTARWK
jgi:hypothetical protein